MRLTAPDVVPGDILVCGGYAILILSVTRSNTITFNAMDVWTSEHTTFYPGVRNYRFVRVVTLANFESTLLRQGNVHELVYGGLEMTR